MRLYMSEICLSIARNVVLYKDKALLINILIAWDPNLEFVQKSLDQCLMFFPHFICWFRGC